MGELITETVDYDGGRRVSAWLPSDPPEAIIYAGDGQLLAPWGADLDRPVAVVALHRADGETERLHEYSPGFAPARFADHERCLLETVPAWARTHLGADLDREHTAVLGVSAGGELALALGMRHPDRFGAILCASPGAGYQPPGELPDPRPRTYLVAGRQEPFFLDNARRWASALSGGDVILQERDGDHGDPFWRQELGPMVEWAFGHG